MLVRLLAIGAAFILSLASPVNAQPSSYTRLEHAEDLKFPLLRRKVALLIGNGNYDQAIDPTNPNSVMTWPILSSPCSDVNAVARQLASLKWKKEEIFVLCDQTGTELQKAVGRFLDAAPIDPADSRLMLLYFAGHGVSIDGRNYLFGVNSRPDWGKQSRRYIEMKLARQTRRMFSEEDAIDPYTMIEERFGRAINFPLLVFIDACRNNPMLGALRKAYRDAQASLKDTSQIEPLISVPAVVTGIPRGAEIVFATVAGRTIDDDDGDGRSRMAGELLSALKPDQPISFVMQQLNDAIVADNKYFSHDQTLDRDGRLYSSSDGEWCFVGCRYPGIALRNTSGVRAWKVSSYTPRSTTNILPQTAPASSAAPTQVPDSQVAAAAPAPAPIVPSRTRSVTSSGDVLFEYSSAAGLRDVTLDIFWCAGDRQAVARRRSANALAEGIDAILAASNPVYGQSKLRLMRVRSLPQRTNERPGYQRGDDLLLADRESAQTDEAKIATQLVKPNASGLSLITPRARNDGYISVFFCKGAFDKATTQVLYVQVARQQDLSTASEMIALLDDAFPALDVQRKAQVMADNAKFPLAKYPATTEVRYFRSDMEAAARQIASLLKTQSGGEVAVVRPAGYRLSQHIEIWVGTVPPPIPWGDTNRAKMPSTSMSDPI